MAAQKQKDPRGGHVRIYWELIDSMAWRALDPSSVRLFVAVRRKLQSTNNGNLSCTLSEMKHYGVASSATLSKCLRTLEAVGLIAKVRQGGIAWGKSVCSLYRFTDEVVFEQPKLGIKAMKATGEWRKFTKLAEAKAAIRKAHADAKTGRRKQTQNASSLQKVKRIGSKVEA